MLSKEIYAKALSFGEVAVNALKNSVSPYNYVEHAKKEYLAAGFKHIFEKDPWDLELGGKYFYTRNNSCIIAFTIGKKFTAEEGCFKIIGAHTDSPSLRIAPNSYNPSGGFERYNIQSYGGGLWHTWLDRDLGLAGKVIYKDLEGKLSSKIIKCDEPLFFIPNCPPHLKSGEEREKLSINKEEHLKPLIATLLVNKVLNDNNKVDNEKKLGNTLRTVIMKELNKGLENPIITDPALIIDYDLVLYDTQEPRLTGLNKEFLSSGRLDNLGSSVPALYSTIAAAAPELLAEQTSINMTALFDNEEIGSMTYQGADSNFLLYQLKRIFCQSLIAEKNDKLTFGEDLYQRFLARSYVISADLAHAFNPNYAGKFQGQHRNLTQEGVVLKINCSGRYSTESENAAVFKELGKMCGVPIQEFIVRQDSPCGTTIGPITSAKLGIKSVDIGIAQFAMHSIRETLGIVDLLYYKTIFEEFFKNYEKARGNILKE